MKYATTLPIAIAALVSTLVSASTAADTKHNWSWPKSTDDNSGFYTTVMSSSHEESLVGVYYLMSMDCEPFIRLLDWDDTDEGPENKFEFEAAVQARVDRHDKYIWNNPAEFSTFRSEGRWANAIKIEFTFDDEFNNQIKYGNSLYLRYGDGPDVEESEREFYHTLKFTLHRSKDMMEKAEQRCVRELDDDSDIWGDSWSDVSAQNNAVWD